MLTHLQTLPQDQAAIAALFQSVADGIQQAVEARQPGHDLRFDLDLSGPATGLPIAESAPAPGGSGVSTREQRLAEARIALAAKNLDKALGRLHSHGGLFLCRTRGEIRGAHLEMALMADFHLMHTSAVLIPGGLFDDYVPRAGGWSRLIERAGAGRASSLLLTRERVGAAEALRNGLCEAIEDGPVDGVMVCRTPDHDTPADIALSATALRLAYEISERTSRTGGMTPRQTRVLERAAFALAFSTGDPRAGIAAFFADRPASFSPGDEGRQDPVKA